MPLARARALWLDGYFFRRDRCQRARILLEGSMAFEQRANTGALFKNERRETDSHPNAQGSATITCPHCGAEGKHWLSAWTNTIQQGDKAGDRYQKLSFKAQDNQPGAAAPRDRQPPPPAPEDDDIPF
jgi:hypothetical protein